MASTAVRFLAALSLVLAAGCEFAAKQTYMAAEGVQSRALELKRPTGSFAFDRYTVVEVEKFNSRIEGNIPANITEPVQSHIVRNIIEAKVFKEVLFAGDTRSTDKPTLVVRGTYIDFHPGAGLNRTIAFGGEGLLTALVTICDGATNEALWTGHVTGILRAAISGKMVELGEGMGEAIQEVMERYHSPPGK